MTGQGHDSSPPSHAAAPTGNAGGAADGVGDAGERLEGQAPPVGSAPEHDRSGPATTASGRAVGEEHVTPVEINALLGRGTEFEGKLHFDGRVRIEGAFRGDIRGDDVLVIGDGAHIIGSIEVSTCIITGGEVEANVRARDAIELYAPAIVRGDLHAPAVFIDRGVQFQGNCKMAPLDEPGDDAGVRHADSNAAHPAAPEHPDLDNAPTVSQMDPERDAPAGPGPSEHR